MKESNESNSINNGKIIALSLNEDENPYHLIKNKNKNKDKINITNLLFFPLLLFLFILISIIIYVFKKNKIKGPKIKITNFTKPLLDNNKYELIELQNGIEVLLIQDNKTEKSSLSLVLKYGFLTDLNNTGISHLIMHYLYSEIQKKTNDDLKEYFGESSSKISRFYTSFNFYCLNDGLYPIIIKFGSIFTQKIKIIEDKILSEIDNYYKLKSNNSDDIEEHLINYLVEGVNNSKNEDILPEGDTKEFKNDILNKTKESMNKYYYGQNIKIVLYSQLKMSLAKAYIIEAFNNITSNKNSNNSNISDSFYEERKFKTNKIISYRINSSVPFIKIIYYIKGISNNEENVYISQAYLNYIEYVLINSYNNSLNHILTKELNYSLRSISVYSNITFNNYIKFSIIVNCYDVNYTQHAPSIDIILSTIYGYIETNIVNSFNKDIFDNLKKAYQKSFIFQDKNDIVNMVTQYGLKLIWRKKDLDTLLYNNFLPEKNEEHMIKFLSSQLIRNNSIVIIRSNKNHSIKQFNNATIFSKENIQTLNYKKNVTKYYKVNYGYINVDFNKLKNITHKKYNNTAYPVKYSTQLKNLIYPNILDKSEYIARDNIKLICNYTTLIIYFKFDRTFKTPKVVVNLKLFHYLSKNNTNDTQFLNLYSFFIYYMYLKIEIEKELREAIIVGNIIEVNLIDDFIDIKIVAFIDVVHDIIKKIHHIIYSPNLTLEKDDIFFLQTNVYISSINDINEYWKYIIKQNFYSKNKIKTIGINNSVVIDKVNDINDSMVVYMYIYGSLNETESKKITELFIQKKSNPNILLSKLDKSYNINKIYLFINQFININLTEDKSTMYYLNIRNTTEKNIQVFYYFGNYSKEKYNKLFLLSKILNSNHIDVKVEVKLLNGLFLFLEKKNKDVSYYKIETSIDSLLKNINESNKEYKKIISNTGIDKFYYLKNNFITHLNKDNLNLIERAEDTINSILYNNIVFDKNQSINENSTTSYKNLKKIPLVNVTDNFLYDSFKNVTRISIRFGAMENNNKTYYEIKLFNQTFRACPKQLN